MFLVVYENLISFFFIMEMEINGCEVRIIWFRAGWLTGKLTCSPCILVSRERRSLLSEIAVNILPWELGWWHGRLVPSPCWRVWLQLPWVQLCTYGYFRGECKVTKFCKSDQHWKWTSSMTWPSHAPPPLRLSLLPSWLWLPFHHYTFFFYYRLLKVR